MPSSAPWLIAGLLGVTETPDLWTRQLVSAQHRVLAIYNPHQEAKSMPLPQGILVDQFHGDISRENGVPIVTVGAKSSACLIMK